MSNTERQKLDEVYKAYEAIVEPAREENKAICDSADEAYDAILRSAHEVLRAKVTEIENRYSTTITVKGKKYKLIEEKVKDE